MFVREHELDRDAQQVYRKLLKAYQTGAAADISTEKLRNLIITMKLDKTWTKGTEAFLNFWQHKILDLETQTNSTIPSDQKRDFPHS